MKVRMLLGVLFLLLLCGFVSDTSKSLVTVTFQGKPIVKEGVSAKIENGSVFVPANYLRDMGFKVVWNQKNRTVNIEPSKKEEYMSRLYTPTYITKIKDLYFIVDCWHNRIIYTNQLGTPINDWKTLDDDLAGPHSIVSDGDSYVVEDTGRNRIIVYKFNKGLFERTQVIENVGIRPHRVRYDLNTKLFYVVTSNSQEIYVYKNDNGSLKEMHKGSLPFANSKYTRSMTIIDGYMYFVSGDSAITKVKYKDLSFDVVETYPVTDDLAQGNDIVKIGQYYYVTAWPSRIVRVKDLNDLASGKSEDLMPVLGFTNGTPYYISIIDGRVFIPQIFESSGIRSFKLSSDDSISDVINHYEFGEPTQSSIDRKAKYPM